MFNFLMKKLLKSKMKDVPEEHQEKIFALIEKNPALFQKIATEAQEKIKSGMNQQDAMMSVMKAHESELKDIWK